MNNSNLNFKGTAIITGATSGLGAKFAESLASKGYHLFLTGRNQTLLKLTCTDGPVFDLAHFNPGDIL